MNEKIESIKSNIENGGNIIRFKRNNRRIGKIILQSKHGKKKVIGLFGDELKEVAKFYYDWLENKEN
ncbi:hypothetical protein [Tepidibacter formicigenes]|uniref:Uncharacterized protein n=1 Tax=Tepidibacter formicigenes DSM 15518 TaxID=1123349 RepID=A0A1M6SK03_9FIRM|nr:hypothetical protein [Tepidibacter formicigenes]SHK44980.1 hypothetical protein SAMN02744037_02363 [Tepidibacter formicigenes DSM 15518]